MSGVRRQASDVRRRLSAAGADVAAIVAQAVVSPDPLERAAATTALAELGEVAVTRTALQRLLLRPGEPDLVRQTALAVLAALGPTPPAEAPDNPVKAIDALKRQDAFADWRIEELALLVHHPAGLGPRSYLDCALRFPTAGLRLLARGPNLLAGARA
jgi:hypothetical protein